MRIIVFSDTHRDFNAMYTIFKRNPSADYFLFLGDGEKELEEIKMLYKDTPVYDKILSVKGNCDFSSISPIISTLCVMDKKIIFLHGHSANVKYGYSELFSLAGENNAQIVAFGHTHKRELKYQDGVYLLNPGSAGDPRDSMPPSYAFIDITDAGIVCNHVNVYPYNSL